MLKFSAKKKWLAVKLSVFMLYKVAFTFEAADEVLKCDR